jgi:hypothetical protein
MLPLGGLVAVLVLSADPAGPVDAAQVSEMDTLRSAVASQIQLQAYDLLDEVVFEWTQHPPFPKDTPVILADVTVPLTLGTGLQALIENHFAGLLLANPATKMTLTHCPQCMAVIVHSGAKGTVVSRGLDAPDALAEAGWADENRHAIFLDFEAEGSSLVLRVRITRLVPELPIVFARSLSTSIASPALLRNGEHLVSAEQARKDYLDALEGRGIVLVPLRLAVRSYQVSSSTCAPIGMPPFVWLEAGVEIGLSQARAWTAGLSVGYSWAPNLHDAWMVQGRFSRLVSGTARSLTRPDLYAFAGLTGINVHGPDALLFSPSSTDTSSIVAAALGGRAQATFVAWQAGLELRVKNRIGAALFVESIPSLNNSQSLGTYFNPFGAVPFQTLGAEVDFCF